MPTAAAPAPSHAQTQQREWTRKQERFRVSLTDVHIEQGTRGDAYHDAVCLAVYDALGDRIAEESVAELAVCANRSWICVRFRKGGYSAYGQKAAPKLTDRIDNEKDPTSHRYAKVPLLLSVWIERYDAGEAVEPIDFELVFE